MPGGLWIGDLEHVNHRFVFICQAFNHIKQAIGPVKGDSANQVAFIVFQVKLGLEEIFGDVQGKRPKLV